MNRAEKEITVEVVGKVSAIAILRILIVIENVYVLIARFSSIALKKCLIRNDKCSASDGIGFKAQFEHNWK